PAFLLAPVLVEPLVPAWLVVLLGLIVPVRRLVLAELVVLLGPVVQVRPVVLLGLVRRDRPRRSTWPRCWPASARRCTRRGWRSGRTGWPGSPRRGPRSSRPAPASCTGARWAPWAATRRRPKGWPRASARGSAAWPAPPGH